jgi:hypothetical protein
MTASFPTLAAIPALDRRMRREGVRNLVPVFVPVSGLKGGQGVPTEVNERAGLASEKAL